MCAALAERHQRLSERHGHSAKQESKRRAVPMTPKLMSFDVFGTLISVRDSSYGAFERILSEAGVRHLDV